MIFGNIIQLPRFPEGKTGFPWNQEVPPPSYQYDKDYYPKISIITPSYNQGQYIEQTIRSVLLQNYPNLEYIVIDGGSTDNTVEILKKYDKFITYWVSEKDNGQSDAINKGIAQATGQIFNWLNSDDYYAANALKTIGELFAKHQPKIVCTQTYYMQSDETLIATNAFTPIHKTLLQTIGQATINQPGMFFDLERIKRLGGVNELLHFAMDWELWLRYLLIFGQENIVCDESIVAYFRLHEQSKTTQEQDKEESGFLVEVWRAYHRIAQMAEDKVLLEKLKKFNFEPNDAYRLDLQNTQHPKAFLSQVVYVHFYEKVLKAFYRQHYKKANFYSKLIDKSKLPINLQKDLAYLRRRIFFKKWFSKF